MSGKEKVFTAGAMIVVGTLTTLGGIAAIGWAARDKFAVVDQRILAEDARIEKHETWDNTVTEDIRGQIADLKGRQRRDEEQLGMCCPPRRGL